MHASYLPFLLVPPISAIGRETLRNIYTTSKIIPDIARVGVKPGVVDLCRNRCWGFIDIKKEEIKREFPSDLGLGVCFKFDYAPMRLFLDKKKCASAEIMATGVELFNKGGYVELAPALTRPI